MNNHLLGIVEKHKSIVAALMAQASKAADEDDTKKPDFHVIQQKRETGTERVETILVGKGPAMKTSELEVDMFPWANIPNDKFGTTGCGPFIFAQITGTNPFEVRAAMREYIKEFHPSEIVGTTLRGVPAEVMQLFFNLFGIAMIPWTLTDACPLPSVITNPITKDHVMLTESFIAKGERTWLAYHRDKCYHLGDSTPTTHLDIWNAPPKNSFILFHPAWKFKMRGKLEWALSND